MTPAEFDVILKAKTKERNENWFVLDNMNALLCTIVAACAGNKDAKPEQFRTLKHDEQKEENPLPEMGDTPEMIQRKLEMLTISMGGKAMPRG